MIKFAFSVLITVFFYSISSFGQSVTTIKQETIVKDSIIPSITSGFVNWNLPAGLSTLIEAYKRENYREQGVDGYRIQLFSDGGNNAKDRAQSLLEELLKNYPEVSSYLTYQQPNFKVRIGNFRTKAEARQFQTLLSQNYPGCFIVRDLIKVN